MKKYKKILIRIVGILLSIIVILVGLGIYNVYKAHPKTTGIIQIPEYVINEINFPEKTELILNEDFSAKIKRDSWGVPHIYADNDFALIFAQGYTHAQDRLWQMEVNRRGSSGTMSEVFGEFAVEMDCQIRTFGMPRVAEETWESLDKDTKFMLEAYAAGINFYIDTNKSSYPIEYKLLGIKPKHWTPIDTLSWGNMLSFYMSYNHTLELVRAKIIAKNGAEVLNDLFPAIGDLGEIIVPEEVLGYQWLTSSNQSAINTTSLVPYNSIDKWGSNNWVVNGQLTDSGMPYLANDTHLSVALPSTWYENGLHGGSFDCVGYSSPGAPFIIYGHNSEISWGITNMTTDVQDLYIEKLDHVETPTQYEYKNEWNNITEVTETIEIKGKSPVEHKVYITNHGPIVNKALGLDTETPIALKWTLYEGNRLLQSLLKLNLASNWDEFRNALRDWDNAAQNFVFADRFGNIGYQAACKMPIRSSKNQGLLPVPGWTGEYEWEGYIPFEELPNMLNPKEGFIATSNNKIISDDYPYLLSYDWSANYRVERVKDLLNREEKLTIEDMKEIQNDTYSVFAEQIMPYLLSIETKDSMLQTVLHELNEWNLREDTDSIGGAVFEVWCNFMIRNVFEEYLDIEVPENSTQIMGNYIDYADFYQPALLELMKNPGSPFFDQKSTAQIETRDDMIRKSLDETVTWLKDKCGDDMKKWQWGNVQTVTFMHMPFGNMGIGFLDAIFNSKKIAHPGGPTTVNVAQSRWNDPFKVIFATSQRMVVDLSDFDQSISVNSTGQTGLLAHKNRFDQTKLWSCGEYKEMNFTEESVGEHAILELELQYSGQQK